MLYPGWHDAAKHIWKAPPEIVERIHSDNITLDCLQALKRDHGNKVKVLFSCSVRDANLAEYIPFVQNGVFGADRQAGISFQHELSQMCQQLMETIPDVGIYIFDQPIQGKENAQKRSDGLTTHCIGLSNLAETLQVDGCTVQEWVWDAVNGTPRKIGLSLLEQFPGAQK